MKSLESLFYTLIANAQEGLHGDTLNVPEEYLHADIPKYKRIFMKLGGGVLLKYCGRSTQSMSIILGMKMRKWFCIY